LKIEDLASPRSWRSQTDFDKQRTIRRKVPHGTVNKRIDTCGVNVQSVRPHFQPSDVMSRLPLPSLDRIGKVKDYRACIRLNAGTGNRRRRGQGPEQTRGTYDAPGM
jgi:hypothetical protein